jgi:hypothetical protein
MAQDLIDRHNGIIVPTNYFKPDLFGNGRIHIYNSKGKDMFSDYHPGKSCYESLMTHKICQILKIKPEDLAITDQNESRVYNYLNESDSFFNPVEIIDREGIVGANDYSILVNKVIEIVPGSKNCKLYLIKKNAYEINQTSIVTQSLIEIMEKDELDVEDVSKLLFSSGFYTSGSFATEMIKV